MTTDHTDLILLKVTARTLAKLCQMNPVAMADPNIRLGVLEVMQMTAPAVTRERVAEIADGTARRVAVARWPSSEGVQ